MKDKQALTERNAKICEEITALMSEKSPRGSQKYTTPYILDIIGEKYDLQTRTIKNIFWPPTNDLSHDESPVGAHSIAA